MKNGNKVYEGGKVVYWDYCEKDKINLWNFKELVLNLGTNYEDNRFCYRITCSKGDNDLEILNDDIAQYLIHFIPANPQKEVEIYIVKEEQDIENEDEVINEQNQDSVELDKEIDLNEHAWPDNEEYELDDYEFVEDHSEDDDITIYRLHDLTVDNVELNIKVRCLKMLILLGLLSSCMG